MDLVYVANDAGPYPLADLSDTFSGVALITHLRGHAVAAGGLREGAGFVDIMSQRFLDIDMLAQLYRGHGHHGVHVVGRGHSDGVNAACHFVEHHAVVLVTLRSGVALVTASRTLVIHIAQCDNVVQRGAYLCIVAACSLQD